MFKTNDTKVTKFVILKNLNPALSTNRLQNACKLPANCLQIACKLPANCLQIESWGSCVMIGKPDT